MEAFTEVKIHIRLINSSLKRSFDLTNFKSIKLDDLNLAAITITLAASNSSLKLYKIFDEFILALSSLLISTYLFL